MTTELMTTDQKNLFRAILDNPDEDTVRLAYADLLDEIGGESNRARAELIRLQCMIARYKPWEEVTENPTAGGRVAKLLRRYQKEWAGGILGPGVSYVAFRRGFVEEVVMNAAAFIRRGGCVRAATPLRKVSLLSVTGRCTRLAASRHLHAIRELEIGEREFSDHSLVQLVTAAAALDSARFASLEQLDLRYTWTSMRADAVAALASCGGMPQLRSLIVGDANDFTDEEAEVLANASGFDRLADLQLRSTQVRGRGLAALLISPKLASLSSLALDRSLMDIRAVRTLSRTPGRPGLQYLSLTNSRIRGAGVGDFARVLERHPDLILDVRWCPIPRTVQEEMVRQFGSRVLVGGTAVST